MATRLAERPAAPPLPPALVPVGVDGVPAPVGAAPRLLMEEDRTELRLETAEESEETGRRSELRHMKLRTRCTAPAKG